MEQTVASSTVISQPTKRLVWIDLAKGVGILWVVYFHFFTNYVDTDAPPGIPSPMSGHFLSDLIGTHAWDSLGSSAAALGNMVWLAVSQVGFHAVGFFVLLGGWSLATATWRRDLPSVVRSNAQVWLASLRNRGGSNWFWNAVYASGGMESEWSLASGGECSLKAS